MTFRPVSTLFTEEMAFLAQLRKENQSRDFQLEEEKTSVHSSSLMEISLPSIKVLYLALLSPAAMVLLVWKLLANKWEFKSPWKGHIWGFLKILSILLGTNLEFCSRTWSETFLCFLNTNAKNSEMALSNSLKYPQITLKDFDGQYSWSMNSNHSILRED